MTRFNSALRMSASVLALVAGAGIGGAAAQSVTITGNQTGVTVNAPVAGDLIIASGANVTPDGVLITAAIAGDISNSGTVGSVFELEGSVATAAGIVSSTTIGDDFINTGVISSVTGSIDADEQVLDAKGSDGMTATATAGTSAAGAFLPFANGSATNSGDISASGSASITASADLAAEDAADAVALGEVTSIAQGLVGGFKNGIANTLDGTVTAVAEADGTLTAHATADATEATIQADLSASSTGLLIGPTASIANDGDIAAKSTVTLLLDLESVAAADSASGSISVSASATAYGVNGFTGGLDKLTNTGTISADASVTVTGAATATSDESQASLYNGNTFVFADSVGVTQGTGKAGPFTNSGEILAKSVAVFDQTNTISAASEAYFSGLGNSITADANGILMPFTLPGFNNSGTISATATSNASNVISLVGQLGAEAEVENSVSATGGSVFVLELKGDATNTGIIASSVNATNGVSVDAKAAEGLAEISVNDYSFASAGQGIGNLDGSFLNDAKGQITSDATAVGNHVLKASGQDAEISGYVQAVAYDNGFGIGVLADTGYTVKNAGVISGAANASQTVSATATATDGSASVFLNNVAVEADAVGLDATDTVEAFDNSGKITAQASGLITQNLSAIGSEESSVYAVNEIDVSAAGAYLNGIQGNAVNSGTISADALGKLEQTITSGTVADPGLLSVVNVLEVDAIGFLGTFLAPPEGTEEAPVTARYTFTNSGTITAKADLQVTASVAGGTGSDTEGFASVGLLRAYGAEIQGTTGAITNSGEISANGNVTLTGAGDTEVYAEVVGLSLPDIGAGGTVINSGKITADLTGAGASGGAVVGLLLGPVAELTMMTVETSSGETGTSLPTDTQIYTTAITDVITVTNTGTISATNTQGPSFGIGALYAGAPVVINQQGGSISGSVAIAMDQGNADTLNWTGGEIHGVVAADALDVVDVFAGTGTPANKTVSAGSDFALTGGASLNIGVKDAPITFALDGMVTGTAVVNVNDDANFLLGPSAKVEAGTLVMDPETMLTFEFDADSAGLIKTTGDAAIDGTLAAVALPDLYSDKGSHTIIETGGKVTGAFDNVNITGDTLLLDFTATVGEQAVTVSWERTPFDGVKGLSFNSAQVAGALEDGYDTKRPASKNTPELNDQLAGLFTLTDAAKYDRVLNSWSGSEHAQVMRAASNLSEPYLMAIGEHLNDNRNTGFREQNVVMLRPKGSSNSITPASSVGAGAEESGFAFWGRAFGRFASTRGDLNADGYDEDTYGAVLGLDFQVGPSVLLGIAGAYIDDDMDFDDGDAGKVKRWSIGGYASATFDAFYVDGSFTYASDSYRVHRTIITGGAACLSYTCSTGAASRYSGDGLIAHAEAGFNWQLGGSARLQPFAGLNFTSIDHDGFTEAGGGDLALIGLDGTGKSLQSRLGLRLSGDWGDGEVKWVPELRAEWRHEFEDEPAWIASTLTGLPSDPFLTIGSHVGRDLAVVGAGITAQMSSGWGLYLDYQGAFASGYNSHVIQGGVRVKF